MSTREQTRRDLKDLAKLAAAMPKDHSSSIASRPVADYGSIAPGASRITVPPMVASVPPPPALPSPPRAFSVSSPPRTARSFRTTLAAVAGSAELRGSWLVAAGSTLVAAMVSGLLLGQSLSSHTAAASTNESPMRASPISLDGDPAAESPPPAQAPTPGASAGSASGGPPATAAASPAASVLEVCAPVATFRAPRPNNHHAEAPKPAPRAAVAARPARHDSLDDLIRRAAAN